MRSIFEPIPKSTRGERLQAYEAFLSQRDGDPDFARGTLSRREQDAERFEGSALRWQGQFDPVLFAEQHRHFDARVPTPAEMLILLVFVKINANEAYGVERVAQRPRRRADDLRARLERLVLLEEAYHTRLLLSASSVFGVRVTRRSAPVRITRMLVAGIAELPERLARPVTLAGEIVGILTFLKLIGAVRNVFRHDPPVRDALEERVTEVLIDEIGHMSFNRLLAGAGAFAALRAVLPAVALGTRAGLPEADALGVLPVRMSEVNAFDVASLPDEVRRRAFIA